VEDTPGRLRGIALSDCEEAEALAYNFDAQFQAVNDLSDPAVIETVDVVACVNICHQLKHSVRRRFCPNTYCIL
jgi:hypothetical protein